MPKQKTLEPFVSPCGKALHSIQDAAECHAASERVIFAAIKSGELPAVQHPGTKWSITCEDLFEWRRQYGTPNRAELERAS